MIDGILGLVGTVINKIFPDKEAAQAAQLELSKLAMSGELAQITKQYDLNIAQAAVNSAEASSGNWFASSWRPLIGYSGALTMFWVYLLQPMIVFGYELVGHPLPPLPTISMGELMPIITGMLGIAGMRSYEKVQGVAK